MKKLISISAIIVAIIVALVWIHHNHKKQVPPTLVTVKLGKISETASAVGSILPKHSITVKSQLAGTVKSIFKDAGDHVNKGDKLLQVSPIHDPKTYSTSIAQVQQDKASIQADSKQFSNYKYLLDQDVIASNYTEYLKAKQALADDKAKLDNDQAQLDLITKGEAMINGKLIQSTVTSPIEGYILSRNVDVGDPVISIGDYQAATSLFNIANMQDLIFKGTVDEIDSHKIKQNMKANITIAAIPNSDIKGQLTKLALQSDAQNQLENNVTSAQTTATQSPFNVGFSVEIGKLIIPKTIKLRSGYSATANIIIQSKKNILIIPENAIQYNGKQAFVNVYQGMKQAPKKQNIKLGISDGINSEVISGLKAGNKIVVGGTGAATSTAGS